jgi:hypothetical protein
MSQLENELRMRQLLFTNKLILLFYELYEYNIYEMWMCNV